MREGKAKADGEDTQKKEKLAKLDDVQKPTVPQEDDEHNFGGLPDDIDFRRNLGCGG